MNSLNWTTTGAPTSNPKSGADFSISLIIAGCIFIVISVGFYYITKQNLPQCGLGFIVGVIMLSFGIKLDKEKREKNKNN